MTVRMGGGYPKLDRTCTEVEARLSLPSARDSLFISNLTDLLYGEMSSFETCISMARMRSSDAWDMLRLS